MLEVRQAPRASIHLAVGVVVVTMRLLGVSPAAAGHGGDVFACVFTPDSAYVLSSGWDGCLKVWDVQLGTTVAGFQADARPLSACAVSPDGQHFLSGSMDGLLGKWEASSQDQVSLFLAHTRPISALRFSPDGSLLASSSWDRAVTLWPSDRLGQGKVLGQHEDIVAGCAFTPDGRRLASWSYDTTASVWDVARLRLVTPLKGHQDRILAGAVSPDGSWLATGSRDRQLKLWSLNNGREHCTVGLQGEARACLFLLDTEWLIVADAAGRLTLHRVPDLQVCGELFTGLPVQCAALAPSGGSIALGCTDGRVCGLSVEGFDSGPLAVTATQSFRVESGILRRLLGGRKPKAVYHCTCPACRHSFELPGPDPAQPASCPSCRRQVRACVVTQGPEAVATAK
jgi:dipeptidyl aminopeptidase/acylaminoacyl peptidase